jgi:hypothetical protein
VTVHIADGGPPIPAQLEENEFHMLWLLRRNRRNSGRVQIQLSAALQNGWLIIRASPDEQALLETHRSAVGRCSDAYDAAPLSF